MNNDIIIRYEAIAAISQSNFNIDEGKQLLTELRELGRNVIDIKQRRLLSDMARNIGERLFDITGEFYAVHLELPDLFSINEVVDSDNHLELAEETGLLATIEMYQELIASAGRANTEVGINAQGDISLYRPDTEVELLDEQTLRQLQRILAQLRQQILKGEPSQEEISELQNRYQSLIVHLFQYLRLEGLTTDVKPIHLPLEKVYVQLRAVGQVPDKADTFSPEERRVLKLLEEAEQRGDSEAGEALREGYLQLDALRRDRWSRERIERFPISQVLTDPQKRVLVILGDPGSGKTTLLQFLALTFARGPQPVAEYLQLTGDDATRLPIIAPLASYDEMERETPGLTVGEFLGRYYDRRRAAPGLSGVFNAALDTGRALVLLDGLDEVTDEGRRRFVTEQVEAFIGTTMSRGNRIVLTSRIYGYRAAPLRGDYPHITVLDFRREEIELFARQWHRALAAWEVGGSMTPQQEILAQQHERELLNDILSNPGVEQLAVNPLLLTMLALLRRQVGALPQRRIKLYELYITALIQTWEENRSRGARAEREQRIDLKEAQGALIHLALWMQQNHLSGTATQAGLVGELTNYYLWEGAGLRPGDPQVTPPIRREAESRAERFMHDMRQYSGLLIERGYDAFGFRHLTFQEYFAGWGLARLSAGERWALVEPNLHSNRWREPILLCAARLGVIDQRDREATELVQRIVRADSDFEELLHRDLFLAADCAADDIGTALPVLEALVEGLAPLLDTCGPALAHAARERLYRLSQLRAGGKPRLPRSMLALTAALPIDQVFAPYQAVDEAKREIVHRLLAEHAELRFLVRDRLQDHQWIVRLAAVQALSPLLAQHDDLRSLVRDRLQDHQWIVRRAAVQALSPLLAQHAELRFLVRDRLQDHQGNVRRAAVQALSPLLAQHDDLRSLVRDRLQDHQGNVRLAAVQALSPLLAQHNDLRSLVRDRLQDHQEYVQQAAVQALSPLLAQHDDLRSLVRDRLQDNNPIVRLAAVQALSPLLAQHDDLRSLVRDRLQDNNSIVRLAAVQALERFMSDAPEITDLFVQQLQDHDWRTRQNMIGVLAANSSIQLEPKQVVALFENHECQEAGTARSTAVEALSPLLAQHDDLRSLVRDLLQDDDNDVRLAAVQALSPLLAQHDDLRSLVRDLLQDDDNDVRLAAVQALSPLLAQHDDLRSLVRDLLQDDDNDVRLAAVQALSPLLAQHDDLRSLVRDRLQDDQGNVRLAAVQALSPLLAQHDDLRSLVRDLLQDDDNDVRLAVVQALSPLLAQHDDLRSLVLEHLQDDEWNVRRAAVEALSPLLAQHDDLRSLVLERLQNDEWNVRRAAVEALSPLLAQHDDLRSLVRDRLQDDQGNVRLAAVEALSPLLAQHDDLRSLVRDRLQDDQWNVRLAAVEALSPLLAQHDDLRSLVLEHLQDHQENVRRAAVQALSPLLAQHDDLRSLVLERLQDHQWDVRRAVVQALSPLLPQHDDLRSLVLERLQDHQWDVRLAAVQALSRSLQVDVTLNATLFAALAAIDHASYYVSPSMVEEIKGQLLEALGTLGTQSVTWRMTLHTYLCSHDWRQRAAAARVLAAAGVTAVQEALPHLLTAINDHRGLDSWPARISAAELLLNNDDYTDMAIDTILPALDYDREAIFPDDNAPAIRKQAALALGKLKAAYRQQRVVDRIVELMGEEQAPRVLDGLYDALTSLAAAPELENAE